METLTISLETIVKSPEEERVSAEEIVREVPYKIYLNEEPIGSSMVLPTGLEEFGVGFLFAQGYLSKPEEVKEVRLCHERGGIFVYADLEKIEQKEWIITSGCGGTGRISRDFLEKEFEPLAEYRISLEEIRQFILEVLKASELSAAPIVYTPAVSGQKGGSSSSLRTWGVTMPWTRS